MAHAFESNKDTYLYDTAAGTAMGGSTQTLIDVVRDPPPPGGDPDTTSSVTIRSGSPAHLQSESTVDAFGNRLTAVAKGCVSGCTTPTPDEEITTTTKPGRPASDPTDWMWRTVESYVTGDAGTARNHTLTTYDEHGNPTDTTAELTGALDLDRFSPPGKGKAQTPVVADISNATLHVSHMAYDGTTGNLTQEEGPNGRCRSVEYNGDTIYQQLATRETTYTGDPTAGTPASFGCAGAGTTKSLQTLAMYDRGFSLVTLVTDMQSQSTKVDYDAFGRLTALYRPEVDGPDPSSVASVKIEYFLPPDLPPDSGSNVARHSVIHTMTQDGDALDDASNYLESWSYVDGFGRNIVGLSEADPTTDGHPWIATDLSEYDNKSAVRRKYLAAYYDGDPKQYPFGAASNEPYGRQRYDAFGRQLQTFDLDGTVTLQSRYHALSSDHWDAADLEPGPHQGTYATEQKDGHGRTSATIERIHQGGAVESRAVKTTYLPTGEPEKITRVRGGDEVVRWMRYDSLGRMVLNVEPDTTKNFNPSPPTDPSTMKAWRYAYDDAGDLVGTSDARGCGANYLYDAAGRLIAEDYSPCQANHAAVLPAGPDRPTPASKSSTPTTSRPQRPSPPPAAAPPAGFPTGDANYYLGRLVAVFDRASVTVNAFDGRGRVTASAVRVVGRPSRRQHREQRHRHALHRPLVPAPASPSTPPTAKSPPPPARRPRAPGRQRTTHGDLTGTNLVTTEYTRRGTLKQAGGSYQRGSTPQVGNIHTHRRRPRRRSPLRRPRRHHDPLQLRQPPPTPQRPDLPRPPRRLDRWHQQHHQLPAQRRPQRRPPTPSSYFYKTPTTPTTSSTTP